MRILARTALVPLFLSLALAPARAGGKDLESTPQAKAYRALLKTVAAGDYEGYKKAMSAESAKGMDAQVKEMKMQPKQAMLMLKTMAPTDVKFTDLKVVAKKATLSATGKSGGEVNYGSIEMAEESGQWKTVKQSWSNKK
ncbi:MAG: hypothetical protein M3542_08430 [Acidobacteriota bacterium]|nr:hypothetical protein [Acidobacteriota bacterium]